MQKASWGKGAFFPLLFRWPDNRIRECVDYSVAKLWYVLIFELPNDNVAPCVAVKLFTYNHSRLMIINSNEPELIKS
jgi:hypothetical protein